MADHSEMVTVCCSVHHDRLTSGLWNLLLSGHEVDFSVMPRKGVGQIRAHRLILDVFMSPDKFAQMAEFSDDVSVFNNVVEFIYTGKVNVPRMEMIEMLKIARTCDFQMLVDVLETSPVVKLTENPPTLYRMLNPDTNVKQFQILETRTVDVTEFERFDTDMSHGISEPLPKTTESAPSPTGDAADHEQFDLSAVKLEPPSYENEFASTSQCEEFDHELGSEFNTNRDADYDKFVPITKLEEPTNYDCGFDGYESPVTFGGAAQLVAAEFPASIAESSSTASEQNSRRKSRRKSELRPRYDCDSEASEEESESDNSWTPGTKRRKMSDAIDCQPSSSSGPVMNNRQEKLFFCVEFVLEKTIDVVPKLWVTENGTSVTTQWPLNMPNSRIGKFVQNCRSLPKGHCDIIEVRILARFSTYAEARTMLPSLEQTSTINSVGARFSKKRKRIRNKRYCSDSSSSSETQDGLGSSSIQLQTQLKPPHKMSFMSSNLICNSGPANNSLQISEDMFASSGLASAGQACSGKAKRTSDRDIYNELLKVQYEQQKMSKQLDSIQKCLQSLTSESMVKDDAKWLVLLPIKNFEQLHEIELRLSDIEEMRCLIHHLRGFVGDNCRELTYRIMRKLFSNNMALQFSLRGRMKKKAFDQLRLFDAVVRSIRGKFRGLTDKEILPIIGQFLSHSTDRDGGREKRRERKPDQRGFGNEKKEMGEDNFHGVHQVHPDLPHQQSRHHNYTSDS